ncbi:MAG: hypothetical protein IT337_01570 [Thermomicrobiales bacterium]|nr:hypothetical protein [Thermomicrobiales bacterium]
MSAPIPGHDCSVYCAADEHCELVYASFDPLGSGSTQTPPWRTIRAHFDDAYRKVYGARVLRAEPAREAPPVETRDAAELTPLVGPEIGQHPWLVWFVPAGPAADAVTAAESAERAARIASYRRSS